MTMVKPWGPERVGLAGQVVSSSYSPTEPRWDVEQGDNMSR